MLTRTTLYPRTVGQFCLLSGALVMTVLSAGCSQQMPDRAERMTRGYIYYLDGAGGGGMFSNWSGGLRQGLLDAGYTGAGEIFTWNTGLGVVADQDASVEYKRGKASECAQRIQQYVEGASRGPGHADRPVRRDGRDRVCPGGPPGDLPGRKRHPLRGIHQRGLRSHPGAAARPQPDVRVHLGERRASWHSSCRWRERPIARRGRSLGGPARFPDAGPGVRGDASPVREGRVRPLEAGIRALRRLRRAHGCPQGTLRAAVHGSADHGRHGTPGAGRVRGRKGAQPGLRAVGDAGPRSLDDLRGLPGRQRREAAIAHDGQAGLQARGPAGRRAHLCAAGRRSEGAVAGAAVPGGGQIDPAEHPFTSPTAKISESPAETITIGGKASTAACGACRPRANSPSTAGASRPSCGRTRASPAGWRESGSSPTRATSLSSSAATSSPSAQVGDASHAVSDRTRFRSHGMHSLTRSELKRPGSARPPTQTA